MSRKSVCSGMTTLFASLLEQIGADYYLVYYPGHINIAVAGNFPRSTPELGFSYRNRLYFIAETTVRNFRIGEPRLKDFSMLDYRFLQKPGDDSAVIDSVTRRPIPWRQ
ncbi:MAG: hypothetical protein JJT75_09105 [Opitutales bacterium]|nr:hypothetical protein [Opitutales bacterium]